MGARRSTSSALLFLGAALHLGACGPGEPPAGGEPRAALSVPEALSEADTEGYLRALEPRTFSFPADHGPHPGYRTEWWYFTGNLDGPDGRRLGYQLTFFRNALAPPAEDGAAERASAWAADDAWLAHFAVTDTGTGGAFRADERLARGAAGLAGAELEPGSGRETGADGRLRLWTEGWSVEPVPPDPGGPAGAASPAALAPLRLRADQPGASIDLRLVAVRPPFLHGKPGEAGLSRKGSEPGQASYYYTIPRLETEGTVTVDGDEIPVRGLSWLDREWSTSVLSDEQTGWDWFSVQLSDGRDLMLYRLRRAGGGSDPASSGSLMGPPHSPSFHPPRPAGLGADSRGERGTPPPEPRSSGERRTGQNAIHLTADDFEIEAAGEWRSPDGVIYPSGWRVQVPSEGLDLAVTPLLPDQELDLPETGVRYWEGAVEVRGEHGGRPVTGRGYVELTGYAEEAVPR